MAEYIKREDAEEVVTHFMHSGGFSVADFIYAFGKIPVADVVERKKGKWKNYIEDGYLECPFCGAATNCDDDIEELHFCFSCGAEMEGE